MTKMEKSTEISTSERLSQILPLLNKNQLRFVIAAQEHPTKKDAADAIGIKPNTVYGWNGIVDEAIRLFGVDSINASIAMNKRVLPKAMAVMIALLDSDNEAVRQRASKELIEWIRGKAVQPIDQNVEMDINISWGDDDIS